MILLFYGHFCVERSYIFIMLKLFLGIVQINKLDLKINWWFILCRLLYYEHNLTLKSKQVSVLVK